MVAHLVRLRLTLLANTLRRSAWQTVGLVLAVLYALGVVVGVVVAAITGGTQDAGLTGQIIILAGAVVVLGWWVIPLLAFGVDATVDPQRFVTFGIPRRDLLLGLTAAGLTSVPGAATLLVAVGTAFAWWRTPSAVVAALVGGLLAVIVAVVGSRALTTALSPVLDSRRSRELLMVVALVAAVVVGPTMGALSSQVGEWADSVAGSRSMLESAATVVAWTPFGAPWGLGAAVHDGAWVLAAARLAVSVLVIGGLWWVWDVSLARSLVRPPVASSRRLTGEGQGWFDRTPSTPTGAVTARCLVYWLSDPRYSASVAIVPLLPILLVVLGGGVSDALLLLAPGTALLLAFSISADIAYDHTAFVLHSATGVSGWADRAGRVLALTALSAPVLGAFLVGAVALTGRWDLAPMLVGLTVGSFGVTAGVSSVMSVWFIYPVSKPGDSPMKQPQGAGMAAMIAQAVSLAVSVVLILPAAVPAILTLVVGPAFGWVTLGVGPVLGIGICLAGIRVGATRYDRRGPELLQRVMAQA
ncbi:MAG: hypothetical protein ACTMHL_04425 [Janibacter sp.]